MPVFHVKSRHQFKIALSGRDVKTSDSCRKLIFKQGNVSFRNQYNAQHYRVLVFHLFLISVVTLVAARAQYPMSLAN